MADAIVEIIEELQALVNPESGFKPRPLKNPNNKWLVRSALQKYVRRGDVDNALRCAEYLYGEEPSYAWHSLQIITIEDIGLGDPDLLTYGSISTLKTVVSKVKTPAQLYGALVQRAACAKKTRSCCELSLGAELGESAQKITSFNAPSADLISDLFEQPDSIVAYFAACALRKRARLDRQTAMIGVLQRMMDEAPDLKLARAAMTTYERLSDTMNLATWPLVKQLFGTASEPKKPEFTTITDPFPPEVEIKGVTSAAFDMHVSSGKRALKAFCTSMAKRDPLMAEFVKRTEDQVKALGSLVFIVEGGQEKDRLWNDDLAELKEFQDRNFAIGYGVPEDLYEPMKELIIANFDVLNDKRIWSAKT